MKKSIEENRNFINTNFVEFEKWYDHQLKTVTNSFAEHLEEFERDENLEDFPHAVNAVYKIMEWIAIDSNNLIIFIQRKLLDANKLIETMCQDIDPDFEMFEEELK